MTRTDQPAATIHRRDISCVLALALEDYDSRPVFDQIRFTQSLHALLAEVTGAAPADDLVSIVREDGALLSFAADPRACFIAAVKLHRATLAEGRCPQLPLRLGIDLGTVEVVEDEFGRFYMSGGGRQDAERVMRQGPPHQLNVTRSFHELLCRSAPEFAHALAHQGVLSDMTGPPLSWYRLDRDWVPPDDLELPADGPAVETSERGPVSLTPAASMPQPSGGRQRSRMWRPLAGVPLIALGIFAVLSTQMFDMGERTGAEGGGQAAAVVLPNLGSRPSMQHIPAEAVGATAVDEHYPDERSVAPVPTASTPTVGDNGDAQATRRANATAVPVERPAPAAVKPAKAHKVEGDHDKAKPRRTESDARPASPPAVKQVATIQSGHREPKTVPTAAASVFLAVRPWGEVYVDGNKVGVTPPLKHLLLAPGERVITIRNGLSPVYRRQVTVEPN